MLAPWLIVAMFAAEPTAEQLPLLKTFREEFIQLPVDGAAGGLTFSQGTDDGPSAERPARRVTLAKPFAIARYEVPQNLWTAVMGKNPSKWQGPRNSVEMLSFDEAEKFCREVTELLRSAGLITPQQRVRLPSESEWEYAARAGTTTRYSFGDNVDDLGRYGWFTGNAAGNDPPVGAKAPNAWKLYDVHGYLWEWCADPWHDDYTEAPTDGRVWSDGGDAAHRVLRGGSWKDKAESLTSTYRRRAARELRDDAVGLRCVLE